MPCSNAKDAFQRSGRPLLHGVQRKHLQIWLSARKEYCVGEGFGEYSKTRYPAKASGNMRSTRPHYSCPTARTEPKLRGNYSGSVGIRIGIAAYIGDRFDSMK